MLVAQFVHVPQGRIDILALVFIAARIAYLVCYLANLHYVRSLTWFVGFVATVLLFLAGA